MTQLEKGFSPKGLPPSAVNEGGPSAFLSSSTPDGRIVQARSSRRGSQLQIRLVHQDPSEHPFNTYPDDWVREDIERHAPYHPEGEEPAEPGPDFDIEDDVPDDFDW